ncbi:C-Myc-binding protein [Intoshia linei]|uniref:histone acetyltransferase n=1 Tax=Intoshia linei TaxID=1819745 RepID=A0A177B2K9_9BILA|nr:C-Myc-binding protein [Intoshia linei]
MSSYRPADSKHEEFKKYLDNSGILNNLTQVLVGLYEEPEKPENPLEYFRRQLCSGVFPETSDVESLKSENAELRLKNEALTEENNELKQQLQQSEEMKFEQTKLLKFLNMHFDCEQPIPVVDLKKASNNLDLIISDNTIAEVLLPNCQNSRPAEIISKRYKHEIFQYYVHFVDFNKRLDEWVDAERIDPNSIKYNVKKNIITKKKKKNDKKEDLTEKKEVCQTGSMLRPNDEAIVRIKNIDKIIMGQYDITPWYFSPYPECVVRCPVIYICEFCLKYLKSSTCLQRHQSKCEKPHPPGNEIYRKDGISFFEIDGRKDKVYAQYFYELTKIENKTGSPEKPLSDLGLLSYRSYWKNTVIGHLLTIIPPKGTTGPIKDRPSVSITSISESTGMKKDDILATIQHLVILNYYHGQYVISITDEHYNHYNIYMKKYRQIDSSCIRYATREWTGRIVYK